MAIRDMGGIVGYNGSLYHFYPRLASDVTLHPRAKLSFSLERLALILIEHQVSFLLQLHTSTPSVVSIALPLLVCTLISIE